LSGWVDILLGSQTEAGQVTSARLSWQPLFGPIGTVAVLVLLVAAAVWLYRPARSDLSRAKRVLLLVLRLAAIACIVPMLMELAVDVRLVHHRKPLLAVAVDVSDSMDLEDRYVTPAAQEAVARALGLPAEQITQRMRTEWNKVSRARLAVQMLTSARTRFLERVAGAAEIRWFRFARQAEPFRLPEPAPSADALQEALNSYGGQREFTSISAAIEQIAASLRGQPLAGIVLLTDGVNTLGPDPVAAAAKWRDEGLRLYPVVIGDENPRDIAVEQVLVDRLLFKGDPVPVLVRLRNRGYQRKAVPIVLRSGTEELARAQVDLRRDQTDTTATITFTPQRAGEFTCDVQVPVQPDEIVEQNNQRRFVVRVTDEKIKVLFIEQTPRWQYRFLKNAMLRDHRIELSVVLVGAEPTAQPEKPFLSQIPVTREAMQKYDLVILGDVDPQVFRREQLEWIRQLVAEQGGGLLALAGPHYNPAAYLDTPIAEVLPVEPESRAGGPARRPTLGPEARFALTLTALGRSEPVISLAGEADENLDLWSKLPKVFWFASVRKARPGATVLAVHPEAKAEDDRPMPLLVSQHFGRGRSFYCGIDETWRWRLKRGDRIFYRLWGQVIQDLGAPHLMGGQRRVDIRTDRHRYARGQTALISIRLDEPLPPDESFFGVLEDEQGRQRRFPLRRGLVSDRLLEGQVTLTTPGLCKIWLEGAELDATAIVEVVQPQAERMEPAADVKRMGQLAAGTGGKMYRPAEFARLLDELPLEPRRIETRRQIPLWDRPWVLLGFVLFLGAEWLLRRLWQEA